MPTAWKDVTTYHMGDRGVEPRTWELTIGGFTLSVSRHIAYGPEDWRIACPLFKHVFNGIDAEEAKAKAVLMVRHNLKQLLEAF